MPFNPYTHDLPVTDIIPEVQQHLGERNTLIVQAPPGAGKSTLLPLALLHEAWLQVSKISLQPPN